MANFTLTANTVECPITWLLHIQFIDIANNIQLRRQLTVTNRPLYCVTQACFTTFQWLTLQLHETMLNKRKTVADLGEVRGVQMHPLWRLVMYFCVHNCTSPSNDYAAVACISNNQAQLYTHVSVPYWSPDVWLGLEMLRDIQFGLPVILNNSLASYRSVATITTCALTCRKWAW